MKSRELVRHFIDEVFNGRSLTRLEEYMREDYMQHSVEVADGREGFRRFCGGFFRLSTFSLKRNLTQTESLLPSQRFSMRPP